MAEISIQTETHIFRERKGFFSIIFNGEEKKNANVGNLLVPGLRNPSESLMH